MLDDMGCPVAKGRLGKGAQNITPQNITVQPVYPMYDGDAAKTVRISRILSWTCLNGRSMKRTDFILNGTVNDFWLCQ